MRHASVLVDRTLTKERPHKSLIEIIKRTGGRNNHGRITVRHRGGGHRRFYRLVDFRRDQYDQVATVLRLEYDPNRTANLALIQYPSGDKSYILAPNTLKVGDSVVSSRDKVEIKPGNRMPLKHIPIGMQLYEIEFTPGRGATLARSAGNSIALMSLEGDFAQLKLPSGEIRHFSKDCMATIGVVGNADHKNIRIGKAGRMRWKGIRPTVRGKAMNPVDHPHGGGEGKHPIGMKHPKTPWGKPALGVKTRPQKKESNRLIIKRRK